MTPDTGDDSGSDTLGKKEKKIALGASKLGIGFWEWEFLLH